MSSHAKPIAHEERSSLEGRVAAPVFVLERHLFFWISQLLERRDENLAAALKPAGLRVAEWRALASLYSRQRLSMSELADLTNIERTTLSRHVDRLFARVWPAVRAVNDAASAGIPEPAVEMARWAMRQMCRNFDSLAGHGQRDSA